jgi:DNA-binding GntR family transcriptional regulator
MAPPRRQNSAVDTLVEALRHDIMTGTLRPGQRIELDEWGDGMGASRTPVRLALERLEAEGFVKLSGRRGATIIDVTMTHIEDVLSTRLVLDAALGRVGAMNISEQDLNLLRSLRDEIEAIKLPEDHAKMVNPAQRFHAHLFQAAGAPMMYRLAMQSVHHTNVFLSSMWFTNRRIAYVGKAYFADLYSACEAKEIDRVSTLIRNYRVDMAGVVLQDRIRVGDLKILPGTLTPAELRRLKAIVDEGRDPLEPASKPAPDARPRSRAGIAKTVPATKLAGLRSGRKTALRANPRGSVESA